VVLVPDAWSARALCWSPLVFAGRISYGVYLWHWPLYQFLSADRTGMGGFNLLAFRVAATLGVATASYLLIEQPIRRGLALPRRIMPAATVSAMAGVAAVVVVMTPAPGSPRRGSSSRRPPPDPRPAPAPTPRCTGPAGDRASCRG
jgi:peptidoglycan/LPS O-acetylase OafA/YrhL